MSKYQSPNNARFARWTMALAVLLAVALAFPAVPPAAAQGTQLAEAVVLVNSNSARYDDFQHFIQPYLDHFGIPYTVLNISVDPVPADIGGYALIVIGHRELDLAHTALNATEQGYIVTAVTQGSGLLNFDGDVAEGGVGRYLFVDSIFNFIYQTPVVDYGVRFPSQPAEWGTVIECTNDANQNPVLPTLPPATVVDITDGLWTEMEYPPRPEPALLAGLDETPPVMHCFGDVPNGTYEVFADLYTGSFGSDLTYFYGYTAGNPLAESVDTVGRSGGEDRFDEYSLGTVTISDGTFDIYFQDANARAIPGSQASQEALADLYARDPHVGTVQATYFGWSSIRLVPSGTPAPTMHWISQLHDAQEWIGTGSMEMSGIAGISGLSTVIAQSRLEPLMVATTSGQGRAVHWGSYDWMSYTVKGPMYGLDDLVWRGAVWAARKPFVMQGLPPLVTMRVTDAIGPFDWIQTANNAGFKPWAGVMYEVVQPVNAAQLADRTNAGMASASVYAKNPNVTTTGDFYYDHGVGNHPDPVVTANFASATTWHTTSDIPISSYVLPVFYEFGTNVFEELQDWQVEFVSTVIDPGTNYGSPWINNAPFRLFENGSSDSGHPLYYAGFLGDDPNVPAPAAQFFNCTTEIRDDAGYEWYPNNDIAGSIGRGTRQLQRALNAMALGSLNTQEPYLHTIDAANLTSIMQGISANLDSYNVEGVTMDQACQYVRAVHTSDIDGATYSASLSRVTVDLTGETDMPTRFYLFTAEAGTIQQTMVDVPQFTGSTQVVVNLTPSQTSLFYLPLVIKTSGQ